MKNEAMSTFGGSSPILYAGRLSGMALLLKKVTNP